MLVALLSLRSLPLCQCALVAPRRLPPSGLSQQVAHLVACSFQAALDRPLHSGASHKGLRGAFGRAAPRSAVLQLTHRNAPRTSQLALPGTAALPQPSLVGWRS